MKKRIIGMLLTVMMVAGLIPTSYAKTESDLISMLRQHTSEPIAKTYYEDFNGDGKREMFVFTGMVNNEFGYDIVSGWVWLVTENDAFPVSTEYNGLGFVLSDDFAPKTIQEGDTKFFQYQSMAGNGNLYTYVCTVSKYNTFISDSFYGYLMQKDGQYVINYSTYDAMVDKSDFEQGNYYGPGRTFKDYWYYFDEEALKFKEYGAIEITKEQFRKFNGADDILSGIDGNIHNILYRGNGIININVYKDSYDYYDLSNILVRYSSSNVWKIDQESEQGFYKAALYPGGAEYPYFKPDQIKVTLNGNEIEFDQPPVMAEGDRVMVPIRAIFEALGYTLEWDQETETATAKKGMNKLVVKVGLSGVHFNGEWIPFDVPNTNEAGRVRVPVRVVSECAGARVDWDGDNKTVILKK